MKKRWLRDFFLVVVLFLLLLAGLWVWNREPKEVSELRKEELVQTEQGRQEYYFKLLNDDEKRAYRQMLSGIQQRKDQFYLTISDSETIDRVYHALLMDHPELYWVHNRKSVYKTTYQNKDYCLFAPGYSYSDAEITEIDAAISQAVSEVLALIPEGADDYEKVKTVYTYVIDIADYQSSEDDQNIAGIFWKKNAVCAGYAAAVQYLLEYLGIPCIYVEGKTAGSAEGHAWNIVTLDGQYYYVDATNGDQPAFLEGDAVQLAEHKTTLYDYLCPFPQDYELTYTPSSEFSLPDCTATEKNFYVLNQSCFDTYDADQLYDYCKMRLDNGAAVIRFKYSNQEAFDAAKSQWVEGGGMQQAAQYYLSLYGFTHVEYHYGILENMKTIYYMF